jgi:two-component system cell cycle response regulator CtrA
MRALLIEDEESTAASIALMLKSEGHTCDVKRLGKDGLDAARLHAYDVILLDLMLPDMEGLEVLRRLRADNIDTPLLILSGLSNVGYKSKGLNIGADDYLIKPFDNRELLARIEAVLRRFNGHSDSVVWTGDLAVNFDTQSVEIAGKRVYVTPKEYRILELLCQRQGVVLSKEVFLDHLYAGRDEPETKIIDVFVCKLRKKLTEASGGKSYIETVWGRGYMLRAPAEDIEGTALESNVIVPQRAIG